MDVKFDRDIMKLFDLFFEERVNMLSVNNFLCSLQEFDKKRRKDKIIILEKENSDYWRIEFSIPENYVIKLRKNVHPFFHEYIYDEISIYSDDSIYEFINRYLNTIFNNIIEYSYNRLDNKYYIDFNDEFIYKSRNINIGERRQLDDDIFFQVQSNKSVDFHNFDNTFKLNLKFEPSRGEDLLDSIIDLRNSIILNL